MAAAANPKTVRLARGKHTTADRGVCVLELASMLEGVAFTDRPASVSPVVGALLRSYNDSVDDERRQDLFRYAPAVLGSRGSAALELRRMQRLLDALDAAHRERPVWRRALGTPPRAELPLGPSELEAAAMTLVRLHERAHSAGAVLALVDELLAVEEPVRRRAARASAMPPAVAARA